ncbi:MAG: sensor histidine kinase [Vulcanimicrobiaceae bacterium]
MDRGPGMTEEELARIFDRFYRGARRDVAGSGLGLSIAKRAVERAHGTLVAESTPGSGSRFIIALPRAQSLTMNRAVQ